MYNSIVGRREYFYYALILKNKTIMKTFVIIYEINYDRNMAYFWNEEDAKNFVKAIKPLVGKGLLQVNTVNPRESNFYCG